MTYGLTSAGFVVKDQATIVAELQDDYRNTFDQNIPFGVNSVFDQDVGILSERLNNLWQLAAALYGGQFPDGAQGAALANVGQITGQTPYTAKASTTPLTITGTAGTLIPAGSQVSIPNTQTIFATTADLTIPVGGSGTVAAQATATGPLTAPAGTLTNIVTPIAGWTSVTNAADAVVGRDAETDADFRARRAMAFVVATGGSTAAMENYVKTTVPGVTFVGIVQNNTDATVGSLPAHSYHATVIGGADAAIAQALWDCHSPGMAFYGAHTADATDSFGHSQAVAWDVGVDVPLYVNVTLTKGSAYPSNGDALVSAALEAYVTGLGYEATIQDWVLRAQLAAIAGITAQPTILFDRNPNPAGSADLVLAANEKPSLDGANITIS